MNQENMREIMALKAKILLEEASIAKATTAIAECKKSIAEYQDRLLVLDMGRKLASEIIDKAYKEGFKKNPDKTETSFTCALAYKRPEVVAESIKNCDFLGYKLTFDEPTCTYCLRFKDEEQGNCCKAHNAVWVMNDIVEK